jgi:HEAT repeat protein
MASRLEDYLAELTSGDDQRAEQAAQGLAGLPDERLPKVLEVLQKLLAAPDADHRWWAVRALAALTHPQAPELLISALEDGDASVRQCAALGLRLRPNPQAAPFLVAALDDADHLVAELAADALAAIGEAAVPILLEVMQNGARPARLEAVRALATIGDPRAIPALFAALDQDSALMEYWASEGLERMGVGMLFFKP